MKSSLFLLMSMLLLTLVGCGSEQFGTAQQKENTSVDAVKALQQVSCSNFTLIKPKVDILYVVDNSESTFAIQSEIKAAIRNTVNSVSNEFDYRLIATHLIEKNPASPEYNSFQVITNSQDDLGTNSSKRILNSSELNVFSQTAAGESEFGFDRVHGFISNHVGDKLFRKGAYLLVVLISNGRDSSVEYKSGGGIFYDDAKFQEHKKKFIDTSYSSSIKSLLGPQQLRFMSVVTHPGCNKADWLVATKSYIQMSKEVYDSNPAATDQAGSATKDSYNLCSNGLSNVFTAVNSSIQQVMLPHKYQYWPITFASFDPKNLKVYKTSPNSAPVQMNSGWSYFQNSSGAQINTRVEPSPGEPTTSAHLIKFDQGSEVVYPDCVSIASTTNLEYFGYVVLPKAPIESSIVLKIKGKTVSPGSADGWQYLGHVFDQNIKVPHNNYSELPALKRSGYMIKLNGSANYYQSGDSVEIYYLPAPL